MPLNCNLIKTDDKIEDNGNINILASTVVDNSSLMTQNSRVLFIIKQNFKLSRSGNNMNYRLITDNRVNENNKIIDWELESLHYNDSDTIKYYKQWDNVPKDDVTLFKYFNTGVKDLNYNITIKRIIMERLNPIVNLKLSVINQGEEYSADEYDKIATINWTTENSSYLGKRCGIINIYERSTETVIHEILHCLGVNHEFINSKDKRVINKQCLDIASNILQSRWISMDVFNRSSSSDQSTEYDPKSIMNYVIPKWSYETSDGRKCDCSDDKISTLNLDEINNELCVREGITKDCFKYKSGLKIKKLSDTCPDELKNWYGNYVMSIVDIAWLMYIYPPKEFDTLDNITKLQYCMNRATRLWNYFYYPHQRTETLKNIMPENVTEPEKLIIPQNCEYSWSDWGNCIKTSEGEYKQSRNLIINKRNKNGGQECPINTIDYKDCTICNQTDWTNWSICDQNTGVQTKSRVVLRDINGVSKCVTEKNNRPCPVDCIPEFGPFGVCNPITGKKTRYKIGELRSVKNNGSNCVDKHQINCPVNCKYEWGEWSKCTKVSEGVYKQTRDPIISVKGLNNGTACPTTETQSCQIEDSNDKIEDSNDKNCDVSSWSDWSLCDKGLQKRKSISFNLSENISNNCQQVIQERKCPVDCKYIWSDWSKCNNSQKTRQPIVTTLGINNGKSCPNEEIKACIINEKFPSILSGDKSKSEQIEKDVKTTSNSTQVKNKEKVNKYIIIFIIVFIILLSIIYYFLY